MYVDRWTDKDVVYTYNGMLLSHKKNEIMPFELTWLDLQIKWSKSDRERQMSHYHCTSVSSVAQSCLTLWNLKKNYTNELNLQNWNRLTDWKQTYGYQGGNMAGRDKSVIWD